MTDEELLSQFEAGRLTEFPHERHVRVAWALAQRYGADEALSRMRAGIKALAARAGQPGKYHETITRAWLELVRDAAELEAHPELMDKRLLARFYSPERLAVGRERWVEPDLLPLRLPGARPTQRVGQPAPDPA
jgi:hypothetical protein